MNTDDDDRSARRADLTALSEARKHGVQPDRLSTLLRSLSDVPSRRDVLRGVAATGFGLALAGLPGLANAKPKRRKKRKKLKPVKPNQYGCLEVNDPCRRHSQCCSGICTGKPGRKRCRAHGTGTCIQGNPGLCETASAEQTRCNNAIDCYCVRTTAGSAFCGGNTGAGSGCAACSKDADCLALGFPAGSACAEVSTGFCAGTCSGSTICLAPCGFVPPPET